MNRITAIIVCVDYHDYLSLTLPYNVKHFYDCLVVTSEADNKTKQVCADNCVDFVATDLFYENGASFNKFAALEHGLEVLSYWDNLLDWICIMDADVVWPKNIDWSFLTPGNLYTPLRRMCESIIRRIPPENTWDQYPLHPQQVEWAGYTQIFHKEDPALGPRPWHQTNWKHAGGPDSFFQNKWSKQNKLRPPFQCLHLGRAGQNWCGRATPYINGTIDPLAEKRTEQLTSLMEVRRRTRNFDNEKF